MGFWIPYPDTSKSNPCPNYKALEDQIFYLVQWELNVPGIDSPCYKSANNIYGICDGKFIHHGSYNYKENKACTIVFDLDGNILCYVFIINTILVKLYVKGMLVICLGDYQYIIGEDTM